MAESRVQDVHRLFTCSQALCGCGFRITKQQLSLKRNKKGKKKIGKKKRKTDSRHAKKITNKGRKSQYQRQVFNIACLKKIKMLHTGGKRKKVSLNEFEEKTCRGWCPAKWRKREAVDAQAARKDSKAFFQISIKAWTWLGGPPQKNYESEKRQPRKCEDRIRQRRDAG